MLNLHVTMRKNTALILSLCVFWLFAVCMRPLPAIEVLSPRSGEVLQGVVAITGTTAAIGFESAEVAFAYESESDAAWFLLNQSRDPVTNGPIAEWDTTTIADGTYRIKVVVTLDDGETQETLVTGLRVRNYTPVEPSPAPGADAQQLAPTAVVTAPNTPTASITYPTPSPFPINPASVTVDRLRRGAFTGAMIGVISISVLMAYLALRKFMNR